MDTLSIQKGIPTSYPALPPNSPHLEASNPLWIAGVFKQHSSPNQSNITLGGKKGGFLLRNDELTLQRPDLPSIKYPPQEHKNVLWVCSYCISFFWLLWGFIKEFMLLPHPPLPTLPLFPVSIHGPQGVARDEAKKKDPNQREWESYQRQKRICLPENKFKKQKLQKWMDFFTGWSIV